MPTVRPAIPSVSSSFAANTSNKKERVVGFEKDVVEGISRRMNHAGSWAAYHFEMHARKRAYSLKIRLPERYHTEPTLPGERPTINAQPSMSEDLQPAQLARKSWTPPLPHTLRTGLSYTNTENLHIVFRSCRRYYISGCETFSARGRLVCLIA